MGIQNCSGLLSSKIVTKSITRSHEFAGDLIRKLCGEGLDFSLILVESTGGRPSTDYALTIDQVEDFYSFLSESQGGYL